MMPLVLLASLAFDESALRESFSKEIQAKEAPARVAAAKKLSGAKEEKTIALLAGHLKDESKDVQLAVVEALEGASDGAGASLKPLAALLVDKKADPDVRLACAKALSKSKYKLVPLSAMIETIAGIANTDKHLHKFGAEVTDLLNKFAGEDFGKGKTTSFLWEQWRDDNKAKFEKEDAARLADYRKSQP